MENEENIVRYTMAELREMNARGETKTDWARLDAMTDEELEASIDWEEEGQYDWGTPYPYRYPAIMETATVCVNEEIVSWFKARSGDYSARMRFVLRDYADAQMLKRANERLSHRQRAG